MWCIGLLTYTMTDMSIALLIGVAACFALIAYLRKKGIFLWEVLPRDEIIYDLPRIRKK